jgi:hypothetical protein
VGRRWWQLSPDRSPGWWVAPLYLLMAVVTLPYIGVLLATLPDRAVSHNNRLTWVGFDVLLVGAMFRTAWLAWHRSPFVVNVASATATLLIVDAWFDVTTSPPDDIAWSFALAIFVEIPAALLSLGIAGRAQLEIARTGAVRPHRAFWELTHRRGRRSPSTTGQPGQPGPTNVP